ncbi:MAG TPA: VWA domain-containing protein [Vicinamibacterales bacterium]|nr:VWA domain-containing protein [Vicinamibacterales bacterium]
MRPPSVLLSLACLSVVAAPGGQTPPPQQPPTFQSGTTLVPVDVRVVDAQGRPITDLQRSDFTVLEDGVPQQIVQFALQVFSAPGDAVAGRVELQRQEGGGLQPQDKRIFLIVLGQGRQVGPVQGVRAAMQFVKQRLLPQDEVAVLAYNRATAFTTDHAKVFETLERYWKKHEWIESRLQHHFSGLAAVYGSREIPPFIQQEIDQIFRGPGALPSRHVAATATADRSQLAADTRRNRDLLQRAELARSRQEAGIGSPFDQSAIDEAASLGGLGFDEYVAASFSTMTDVGNLYAGIRYLRWLDGEKHLVFLTPGGLLLPRLEDSSSIAAYANDARVVVDIVHTYGHGDAPLPTTTQLDATGRVRLPPMPGGGGLGPQMGRTIDSLNLARLTGGQMMAYRSGSQFFKALDETTRSQYLLGYTPTNARWDGKYRRIEVKVNRRGARALYRHGYVARRDAILPVDRAQYLIYTRIAGAANVPRDIEDVKVSLSGVRVEGSAASGTLIATIHLPAGAIQLRREGDTWVGKAEVVSFTVDARQRMNGEAWQTLDFILTQANYGRFMQEGASYELRIALQGAPRAVKSVVFDYNADLVGSTSVDLRKR